MAAVEVRTQAQPVDPVAGIAPLAVLECHTTGTQYEAERRLGAGAFGTVWLCREHREGEWRAVKVLSTTRAQDVAREVEQLQRASEAERTFVPKFYESGEASVLGVPNSEHLLIAMEYINGVNASELAAKGPLYFRCASTILGDVASALGRLHENGIVHRDVKGDNVLVSSWGHSYLCDFGISGLEEELRRNGGMCVVGTPDFMAPELFGPVPQFTTKVDVWAFGIFAIELGTGQTPARDPNLRLNNPERIMTYIALHHPPSAPDVDGYPATYAAAANSCLMRDPDERPSMVELAQTNRFVREQGEPGYWLVRECLRERGLHAEDVGRINTNRGPRVPWNPFDRIPNDF